MTYGYQPPPHDWRAQGPDDEESGRPRRHEPEPPNNAWDAPPAPTDRAAGRRIPRPPLAARHVPPAPGQQPPAPYSAPPRSPQPYSAPPRSPQPYSPQPYPPEPPTSHGPTSHGPTAYPAPPRPTPPRMRRPPPNNQPGQAKGYPSQPPPAPRIPPPPTRTGPPTGGFQAPAPPGKGGPPTGALTTSGGARNFAPPAAPNRAPAGKPGTRSPARPAPPLPRAGSVSFKDVQGLIKQLPQHRPWMIAIGAIAVAVIVTICGLGSYLLVKDDSEVVSAAPTPESTVVKRDITSRDSDPNPLTAADVFPNVDIVVDPAYPPYKRQGEPQVNEDCRVGANGEVGRLLAAVGCNQVIRATFGTPDAVYLVTAGIFNLPDAAAAAKASTDIKALVDQNQGRFTGYSSDTSVNLAMVLAPTNLAWEVRGHFIVYTVIARVDRAEVVADDPAVVLIRYDILQKYLRDHVILDWSIQETPPSPSPPA